MENNSNAHIQSQVDAVIHFIQKLDIDMIDDLLLDDREYQDFPKAKFVQLLGIAFQKFKDAGDTFLNRIGGYCNSENCNYMCKGFSFIGNHSNNYLDLIIVTENDVVTDMYECSNFKSIFQSQKNLRIEIHEFDLGEYPEFDGDFDDDDEE